MEDYPYDLFISSLQAEKDLRYFSGLYAFTQWTFAYNSNRIEGSALTEEQTAELLADRLLPAFDGGYRVHDVEEATGHFLMFDRMLDTVNEDLSEDLIKSFHYELKSGVYEDRVKRYAIGNYKEHRNVIGMFSTTNPWEVPREMENLLTWYAGQKKDILALAEFHARYEMIHPFQDGNGRTGRVILFRECLKNNINPAIIEDVNRAEYIEGLKAYRTTSRADRLALLIKREGNTYRAKCKHFIG